MSVDCMEIGIDSIDSATLKVKKFHITINTWYNQSILYIKTRT